jgi:hypothetical protein
VSGELPKNLSPQPGRNAICGLSYLWIVSIGATSGIVPPSYNSAFC